jgi:hypothetical protein
MGSIFTGNPLTQGAAYLYYEFATGNLSDYAYTKTSSDVDALQKAIWYFMGVGPNPLNKFVTDANNAFGGSTTGAANALLAGDGGYAVEVMNLWTGSPHDPAHAAQDMLVLRVPDGGLTVILLGIGIGVLAVISRRLGR